MIFKKVRPVFLSLVLMLCAVRAGAQDWRTVRPGDTAYFSASLYPMVIGQGPDPMDTVAVRAVWVSGVQASGGDTTYPFFTGLRAADFNVCVDTAAPHWLGPGVTRFADGRELYRNSFGDSILFYPQAPLFFTWTLARDTAGRRFEGTVGAVGTAMVDGVPDSIKTVYLQAFLGSTPVPHHYNSLVLQWSKSHGWIRTLDLFLFPNDLGETYVAWVPK